MSGSSSNALIPLVLPNGDVVYTEEVSGDPIVDHDYHIDLNSDNDVTIVDSESLLFRLDNNIRQVASNTSRVDNVVQEKSLAATHIETLMKKTYRGQCLLKWYAKLKETEFNNETEVHDEDETQAEQSEVEDKDETDLVYIKEKNGFDKYLLGTIVMENEFYLGKCEHDPDRFKWLADGIAETFDGQFSEDWYDPAVVGSKFATGILYNKFVKLRGEAISLGEVHRKKSKKSAVIQSAQSLDSPIFDELKNFSGLIDQEFLQKWDELRDQRVPLMKRIAIKDFIESFKIFESPNAYSLLTRDFDKIYPELATKLQDKWPELAKKVFIVANSKKTNKDIAETLAFGNTEPRTERDPDLAFLVLGYLLGPFTCSNSVGGSWRAAADVVQKSFIQRSDDVEQSISDFDNLSALYNKYTKLLPIHITCIGQTMDSLLYFLRIGIRIYKVPSLINAVSMCFKIGYLFEERFPIASMPVWQFLKESIYEMNAPIIYSSVRTLLIACGRFKDNAEKGRTRKAPETLRKSGKSQNKKRRTD